MDSELIEQLIPRANHDRRANLGWRLQTCQRTVVMLSVIAALLGSVGIGGDEGLAATNRPHVVVIMADDLGYGDAQPLNPKSGIPTPALNRIAAEGLTFTDAHTPSAVCTPTRYGLLTGRYCWRSSLKRGVLNGYGAPLIESDRATIGSVFAAAGYRTAIVGKWHLGLGLHGDESSLDLSKPLSYHPGTVGFERSFVIPASLDFPPYVYFRDGQATTEQTVDQPPVGFPAFTRKGPRAVDFELRGCLDRLTDEAVDVVRGMKGSDQPTLLYFPLTAPHKPVLPSEEFAGTSSLGPYGDFVRQVDATIGRVVDALDQEGVLDETLLIVTSDNGSYMYRMGQDEEDHVEDPSVQGFRPAHHRANANWRGTKADIWEAGHRVPLLVRLPGAKHAGSRITHTVGLVDMMSTLAEWSGIELPLDAGPDSESFALLLADPMAEFDRGPLICHSGSGMFAIRDGQWKLVAGNGSGGREKPKGTPFEPPWMLFNLIDDPEEQTDLAESHPDELRRLARSLRQMVGDDGPDPFPQPQ